MSTGKGKKRLKNIPVLHEEIKKQHGIWMTDSSWLGAKEKAVRNGLSISEYLERLVRKDLEGE
ncbi:MAG: hypothetical protein AAFW70_05505 [Cyanobacteria bacterium J06635_10]